VLNETSQRQESQINWHTEIDADKLYKKFVFRIVCGMEKFVGKVRAKTTQAKALICYG
jgi:hypothetical protein